MRSRQPKDDRGVVQRIARARFTVASAAVICTAALAAGNATAAFGSAFSSPPSVTGSRPHSPPNASRFSRWLGLRGHGAGLGDAAGSRGPEDSPTARTIAVGGNPVAVAVDQATHTAYVGNGNDGTVSVINTATCNTSVTTGCGQTTPTVAVGPGPVDDVVDQATDTVYVVNLGSNTVSVINGATCNATNHSGCGHAPATVTVGEGPDGIATDQATDTVYVTNDGPGGDNSGHTVSVINGATCNGQVTSGCGQTPATVQVGTAPAVPAVDQATNTVYVPNSNPGGAGSVSVIDGTSCNAVVTTGCGQVPPTVAIGPNSFGAAVDQATDTVYVTVATGAGTAAATNLGSVEVIDGAICNATVTSGCGRAPAAVTVGSIPIGVVVDPVTKSVFVLNEDDSTVSVIDGATCNAHRTAGLLAATAGSRDRFQSRLP